MFPLRHTGVSACLKSVFCLALTLSPVALTAQSTTCVLNPAQFAYVANQENNTISGYSINPSNGLITNLDLSGFPTPAPGLVAVAVDPTSRFVYAINSGSTKNVEGFTINCSTGKLTTMPGTLVSAGFAPTALTVDPSGRYVYVLTPSN
jgi:6-phosphogluconolactonase